MGFLALVLFSIGVALIAVIVKALVDKDVEKVLKHRLETEFIFDYSFRTKLVGVTFNGIQTILPRLRAGMEIIFVHEKNNDFDKNAVSAKCAGVHIGYLSANIARDIAPLLDSNIPVMGKITAITGGGLKCYGCNIEVLVYKPNQAKETPNAPAKKKSELKPTVQYINEYNPLYMKICAVYGTDKALKVQCVLNLGGIVKANVNDETDFVIALNDNWLNSRSANVAKAKEIIDKGGKLKVLTAEEFSVIKKKYLVK